MIAFVRAKTDPTTLQNDLVDTLRGDAISADRAQSYVRAGLISQRSLLNEFPNVGKPGSSANQTFIRAFNRVGNDPRKALAVARAVFGGS